MKTHQTCVPSTASEAAETNIFFRDRWASWKASPFLFSLAIHVVLMACWILPLLTHGAETIVIEAAFQNAAVEKNEFLQAVEVSTASPSNATQPLAVAAVDSADSALKSLTTSKPTRLLSPTPAVRQRSYDALRDLSETDFLERVIHGIQALPMHAHRGKTRVVEVGNSLQVASTLQGDLLSIAKEGDAMVVWLLDQSISMQKDTKTLASALKDTLQEIQNDKSTKMQHAVVAFGDGAKIVRSPTVNGLQVAQAIYHLPTDPSGIERTFESVEWCVNRLFQQSRRTDRQRLLILWTDESGDDYQRLESTIARCRQANVRVDVIGPSSVLGAQTGFTSYLHPADNLTYFLPVHRGPDSAFPQKLSLGYWYRDVPPTYNESLRGPHQGTSPRWHGGSDFKAMLSGFSPYSLTRLARETGGRYLMFDRPGDRPPFSLDTIREYQPDYRSIHEIQVDLQHQHLRQIVLASTLRTWNNGQLAQTQPSMKFPPGFAGQSHNDYVRNKLVPSLTRQIQKALADAQAVENALQPFLAAKSMPGFIPLQDVSRIEQTGNGQSRRMSAAARKKQRTAAQRTASVTDDSPMDLDNSSARDREPQNDEEVLRTLETRINEDLLQQLYRNETSARWRAWSDLNMGRLLALSVRLREYLVVSTGILNNLQQLQADTNSVTLMQSRTLNGGVVSQQRLALATKLLERCVQENKGTAWQVMAARELRYPVGLKPIETHIRQRITPAQPMPAPAMGRAPVRPQLPNL